MVLCIIICRENEDKVEGSNHLRRGTSNWVVEKLELFIEEFFLSKNTKVIYIFTSSLNFKTAAAAQIRTLCLSSSTLF